MDSNDIVLLLMATPLFIGILIYRIIVFKSHDYSCPYCGYKIPMKMFEKTSNMYGVENPESNVQSVMKPHFLTLEKKVNTKIYMEVMEMKKLG